MENPVADAETSADSGGDFRGMKAANREVESRGVLSAPATVAAVKPSNVATPKPSRAPRAPSSNVPAASSDSKNLPAPVTPAKAEASQSYTLQFGSISPGFMNGMQARHDSLKAPPTIPFPSVPRQLLPNVAEGYPSVKPKREAQASVAPPVSQTQKPSVHPIPGVPIQMQFHQPSVPVQFGGPNPQIQSQTMSATSLPLPMPMPIPLQIGNPSVQQQVLVSGLQSHPMQPQGILHQSQNLSFSSQMGPQISPQVGSMGLNMAPQFPQQQAGKFRVCRKAVKIERVKQVNIDNAVALMGVILQFFDKALMEPTFCEMYANFCYHLAAVLPDFSVDNDKITFKRLLLNKCQEEFEREREQDEANKADVKVEAKQSAEEREEKRLRARRRRLGNIRLIWELYKNRMLNERIMHECIKILLGQDSQYQNPDEEDVEALCKLMSNIGEMIDHPKAKKHMDVYFDMMEKLSNSMKLSSRVRFILKDAIDLRKNKWQQRSKVEGPKKIEEVHRDAAQERQAQARGLARTPSMGPSVRRGQPIEYSPRGTSMLASPGSQMGGFCAVSPQLRGYGAQDIRMEERHTSESRTLSVPLPQRPLGDDSITLGMSFSRHSASPGIQLPDLSSTGDSRRVGPGLNGYNPISDRTVHSSREDPMQRYMPDRFAGPSGYEQSSTQERNIHYGNRYARSADRGFDRSLPMSPPAHSGGAFTQNVTSDKLWPEER